jgi:hypothetical protein
MLTNGKRTSKKGIKIQTNLNDMAKSNLLPTPTASDSKGGMPVTLKEKYRISKNEKPHTGKLADLASSSLLPTPTCTDGFKSTRTSKQNNLNKVFQTGGASQLNPLYVGEMMGFPAAWTVLPFLHGAETPSKDSETP